MSSTTGDNFVRTSDDPKNGVGADNADAGYRDASADGVPPTDENPTDENLDIPVPLAED